MVILSILNMEFWFNSGGHSFRALVLKLYSSKPPKSNWKGIRGFLDYSLHSKKTKWRLSPPEMGATKNF